MGRVTKPFSKKSFVVIIAGVFVFLCLGTYSFLNVLKIPKEYFYAPGNAWESSKKVEDYFIESMNMTPQEASEIRTGEGVDGMVNLRTGKATTLDALVSNLYYFGFVRDEEAFRYALTHTKDTTPSENAIMVEKDGTIDRNAEFRISEKMTAWEIADILLNKPSGHFAFDEYNYFFMP